MEPQTHEDDPLIGKTLSGRFRIIEPIGSGGMGRVYKAMQTGLERVVALKVLNPKYAGDKDPGFAQRFVQEARETARLNHPNTVKIHDFGITDDGMLFIAMEFIDGETLQALLTRMKSIGWMRVCNIAGQIARSLREAHKLGIIHRDLKPANVMTLHEETGSDLVKVLDFGLVKKFMQDDQLAQAELTQAGVLLGSPLYMAPESAKNEADQRADIYSLGVLMFQCITGRPPFTGKDSIDIIVKHIREKPPRMKSFKPEVPDELETLVQRCLEKEPADRYQSMDEVLEALKVVAPSSGISGAFTDPRAAIVGSQSGALSRPNGPAVIRGTMPTRSIEVQLDSGAVTAPRRNLLMFYVVGAIAAGVLVVAGITWLTRKPKPVSKPPVVVVAPLEQPPLKPPDEPPRPPDRPPDAVAMVTFDVSSTPAGATVTMDGHALGITPFTFPLKAAEDNAATAELTFMLDGYQSATVSAHGSGTVQVTQALKKKVTGKKKQPKDPGFKDDPYQ